MTCLVYSKRHDSNDLDVTEIADAGDIEDAIYKFRHFSTSDVEELIVAVIDRALLNEFDPMAYFGGLGN